MSQDGRVIPFKKPPRRNRKVKEWRLPSRQEIADTAEKASRTFLNLAIFTEMLSKALRAVSDELGERRYRHRR